MPDRPEYFNINQFIHNGSEWCCGGVYENVLAQSDNPTARLKGKRLLIFELENIKAKPQLLSIVVHLIGIAIRTLVWEQPGKRGFIIYEEFAELMQMDMIFSAVLYQMQAIRKKDGSACIVLQNLDQLALNAGDRYKKEGGAAGALMKISPRRYFSPGQIRQASRSMPSGSRNMTATVSLPLRTTIRMIPDTRRSTFSARRNLR